MCLISIIMPLGNNEKYIHDAIKSVLNQSFVDFELIILNFESIDNALSIAGPFKDKRICIVKEPMDYVHSLNVGIEKSSGKYISLMYADDIMHVDRLKIQYATMEAEPTITVCSTRMKQMSDTIVSGSITNIPCGWIDNPLLSFLRGNRIFHFTAMIRKNFLIEHDLHYENCCPVEDFKLWVEIAKNKGQFYIDSQFLHYHRISDSEVNKQKDERQKQATDQIINEILEYLADMYKEIHPELQSMLTGFKELQHKELIKKQDMAIFFYNLFKKIYDTTRFSNLSNLSIKKFDHFINH
ncbi:glycosyl transferase [Bacteroidia bacterium]|nr:glycosyl transferase [Bacteroidia bacterium]